MRSRGAELPSAAAGAGALAGGDALAGAAAGAACAFSVRKLPRSRRGSDEVGRSGAEARGASVGCEPPMMAVAGIAARAGVVAGGAVTESVTGLGAAVGVGASGREFVSVEPPGADTPCDGAAGCDAGGA